MLNTSKVTQKLHTTFQSTQVLDFIQVFSCVIIKMNKALQSLPECKTGMVICSDDSGYWLEILGVKNPENDDLMSIARNLVLINKDNGDE